MFNFKLKELDTLNGTELLAPADKATSHIAAIMTTKHTIEISERKHTHAQTVHK